jgi:hypothetical protein
VCEGGIERETGKETEKGVGVGRKGTCTCKGGFYSQHGTFDDVCSSSLLWREIGFGCRVK